MEIRKVPISLLNAAPYNPRKDLQPGDPEYQKIARSIEKYGCVEPIIPTRAGCSLSVSSSGSIF